MVVSVDSALFSGPYTGNGATVVWDYDFKVYDETELTLVRTNADNSQTVLELTTDYTVSGVGNDGGGTVTLVSPARLPTGATMVILPDIRISQDRPFGSQTSISLREVEAALDKATSIDRQLKGLVDRAAKSKPGVDGPEIEIGIAGQVLLFGADGNIEPGDDATDIVAAGERAQAWAESPTAPDGPDTMSSLTAARASVAAALAAQEYKDLAAVSAAAAGPYADRAAFLAANTPAPVMAASWLSNGQRLPVERDASGTIVQGDGTKWSPLGDAYPDHWAENTTPGTTDMADALIAGWAYTNTLHLLGADYRVSKMVRAYARNGKSLIGSTKKATRILADTGSFDVFRFYTGELSGSTPLAVQGVVFRNVTIDTPGTTQRTGGYYVNFEERAIKCEFTDVLFDNPYHGIKGYGMAYAHFTRCYWEGSRRTTAGGKAVDFITDEFAGAYDIDNLAGIAKPTDVHFTDCQINPQNAAINNPFSHAVYIGASDGIYFNNCHLRGATDVVEFATAEAAGRTVVSSVHFTGCYFDQTPESHVKFTGYGNGHTFRPVGATVDATVKFRDIIFTGCRFRDASGVNGSVYTAMTSGFVDRVQFNGGTSRDHQYSGIRGSAAGKGFRYASIQGVTFSGNNLAGDASHGDVYLRNNGHTISDNVHIGGHVSAGYAIRVIADGAASVISGNNLLNSTYPTKVSFSACSIFGNPGFVQVNEGTATLAAATTEIVVSHGLDVTPNSSDVRLTMGDATVGGITRVGLKPGTVTATQFTIESNAAPASDFRVYWKVDAQVYT